MAEVHKEGEGLLSRRAAFWGLAILIVWGGLSLYTWLINTFSFCRTLLLEGDNQYLDGIQIPLLGQRLDVGFVISWAVVIAGLLLFRRWMNRPRTADFLIETDDELKKVTWPSWPDARNSSWIVLVFVGFLALFLWGSDFVLGKAFELLMSLFTGS